MSDDNGTTTIETKWGKISGKRTSELVAVLSLCVLAVGAYALHKHDEASKEGNAALVTTLKELASATQGQVKEQRVMNCLLASKQEDRRAMLSECERIAR